MTRLSWWAYLIVFAVPTLLTVMFTPVALSIALRLRMLDVPTSAKAHKSPVPYLGGAAIVTAFSLIVMGSALIRPPDSGLPNLAAVLGMALLLSSMGLVDDIRGLSPWLRLGVEAVVGAGVWATGARADLLPGQSDILVTIAWVVVVTNAFNLLDNMDGLSAGVAMIAAGFLFVVAFLNGQFLVASLAIALAGCALGFLRHNFHPARIYMGDAGSLFIGFLMAVLTLRLRTHSSTRLSFFIPLLILGVPLFDTALVTINRVCRRRSPFRGGQDHVSHRLVRLGIPVRGAVSLIYGAGVAVGWLGLIEMRSDRATGLMLVALVLCVGVFCGSLLSLVPVYDRQGERRPGAPARETVDAIVGRSSTWAPEGSIDALAPVGAAHVADRTGSAPGRRDHPVPRAARFATRTPGPDELSRSAEARGHASSIPKVGWRSAPISRKWPSLAGGRRVDDQHPSRAPPGAVTF